MAHPTDEEKRIKALELALAYHTGKRQERASDLVAVAVEFHRYIYGDDGG